MTDDFTPEGVLAKALSGFKPRESQRLMADAIRDAIGANNRWWWRRVLAPARPTPIWCRPCVPIKGDHFHRL